MSQQPALPKLSKLGIIIFRFILGAGIGLAIGGLNWLDMQHWHPITIHRGTLGSLVLMVSCGLLTAKWGGQAIEAILYSIY